MSNSVMFLNLEPKDLSFRYWSLDQNFKIFKDFARVWGEILHKCGILLESIRYYVIVEVHIVSINYFCPTDV